MSAIEPNLLPQVLESLWQDPHLPSLILMCPRMKVNVSAKLALSHASSSSDDDFRWTSKQDYDSKSIE